MSVIPSPETGVKELENTAGLRLKETICCAKTEAVGTLRVFT